MRGLRRQPATLAAVAGVAVLLNACGPGSRSATTQVLAEQAVGPAQTASPSASTSSDPSGPEVATWNGPPNVAVVCPEDELLQPRFVDVPMDGVHTLAVDCAAWWHLARGRSDGTFDGAAAVTRAEVATLLARLLSINGITLPASPPDLFRDDDGSPHERSINRLAALDVVNGIADGRYGPGRPVTRAQLASLVVRLWPLLSGTEMPDGPDAFTDDDDSRHEPNIQRAYAAGILEGVTADLFDPGGATSRAQMASLLTRILGRLATSQAVDLPVGAAIPAVTGVREVSYDSIDHRPSVYADDSHTAPVDRGAADALVTAVTRWLDAHITSLARGGPGLLDQFVDAAAFREAWAAGTAGLIWQREPDRVVYDVVVAHDGAPAWVTVTVTVEAGKDTATWELLAVPTADGFDVLTTSRGER